MSNIIPIKGKFTSCKSLLKHITENIKIESFVIYFVDEKGEGNIGHFNVTKPDLAFASLAIGNEALTED